MNKAKEINEYKPDLLKRLLREMLLIRRFEEKAGQMYGLQKIGGFCHLYIGQEAVATGAIATLDLQKDYVITAYRDHGHALAVGMDPRMVMAELYGKEAGCSRGKGGSMHMFDRERHFLGGHGIVGGHIPLGTGAAFKIRYNDEDGVVLCFFGDGAIHQGAFHESMNMARIWQLPIIFIIENNHYGMGTNYHRVSSVPDFSSMGTAYDIIGEKVNGMDVLDVYKTVLAAVTRARLEKVPMLIEAQTYRYKGHSMSDPAKYRTKEELEEFRRQDPIILLRDRMISAGIIDEAAYKELDKECRAIAGEAAEFAEQAPEPPLHLLYEDVLAEAGRR